MSNRSLSWIGPLTLGAAAMFLFDPARGRRRRALIRDAVVRASRKTRDGVAALGCDLQNRTAGLLAKARGRFESAPADDQVIEQRVRAQLGRVCSHPAAITVFCAAGHVTLSGPILTGERAQVVRAVQQVRGVTAVIDSMQTHDTPGSVPSLQGGRVRPDQVSLRRWAPAAQLMTAVAGIGAAAYGVKKLI